MILDDFCNYTAEKLQSDLSRRGLKNFNNSICFFIDLLGFSNQTKAAFKNNYYKTFYNLADILNSRNNETQELNDNKLNYFSAYSDSIIWIISYNKDSSLSRVSEFDDTMLNISIEIPQLLFSFIESGFFFRGGLSFGKTIIGETSTRKGEENPHHFFSKNILFSEALTKSVEIESTISYPIIGVHEDQKEIFLQLDDSNRKYKESFKHLLQIKDIEPNAKEELKEKYFLDHLSLIIDNAYSGTCPITDITYVFETHYRSIEKATEKIEWKDIQPDKKSRLLEKYDFLKKYHNYILNKYHLELNKILHFEVTEQEN